MKDATARRLSSFHRFLLRASNGRVGRRFVRNDMLLLTTRGRRTGHRHTVPLLYLAEGGALAVIASWGGRDYHPDWYLNLIERPRATIEIRGRRSDVAARVTTGLERARWWDRATTAYPGYEIYQSRTDREIPVVVLERDAEG